MFWRPCIAKERGTRTTRGTRKIKAALRAERETKKVLATVATAMAGVKPGTTMLVPGLKIVFQPPKAS